MTLDGYQERAGATDWCHPVDYYVHGLCSEAGEVAAVRKRELRGDWDAGDMRKEIGDVLWYVARLAEQYAMSLDDVAQVNLDKLRARAEAGTIAGKGDER